MSAETKVLTDEQIRAAWAEHGLDDEAVEDFARAIEQAILNSPGIVAMRKDAERYRFCRGQFSPAEIHVHGVELGLAGAGLDEAMDETIKEWKA